MKRIIFSLLSVFISIFSLKAQVSFSVSATTGCAPLTVICSPNLPPGTFSHEWISTANTFDTANYSFTFTNPYIGNFIKLNAYDASGNLIGWYSETIYLEQPVDYFYLYPRQVCPNEQFNLGNWQNNSTIKWVLGADTIDGQWANYSFGSYGYHKVTCIVYGPCSVDTLIDSVEVRNDVVPIADFYFPQQSSCPGTTVGFNSYYSTYSNYSWDFGDLNTTSGSSYFTNHIYTNQGTYPVTLTVTNLCGNTATKTNNYTVANDAPFDPNFTFNFNFSEACPGQQITFWSDYIDNGIYSFDFGDGTPVISSYQSSVVHTFADTGYMNVSLTVTNSCGGDTVIQKQVYISNNAPVLNQYLNANTDVNSSCPGQYITFNCEDIGGDYIWLIDGDTVSINKNTIIHQFADTGLHQVSVTIINGCGNDTTITANYHIVGGQQITTLPNINISPNPTCPNSNINFRLPTFNNYNIKSVEWDFGDGIVTLAGYGSIVHYYDLPGVYTVKVKFTTYCDDDSIVQKTVTINANHKIPSNIIIDGSYKSCPNDLALFFLRLSPSGIIQFQFSSVVWNYGDGSSQDSTSSSSTWHKFLSAGNYTVSAKIYNKCGNDTTIYFQTEVTDGTVNPLHTADLSLQTEYGNFNFCPNDKVVFYTSDNYSRYYWDYGDGNWIEGNSMGSHRFDSIGTYNIRAKIVTGCGYDSILTLQIYVENNASIPNLSVSATSVICPGEQNKFSVFPTLPKYFWDFGNGDTVTVYDDFYIKQFDSVGIYNVSITAYNSCGNSYTINRSYAVADENQLKAINVNTNATNVCPGDIITASVSNGLSSYVYSWDFGDGESAVTIGLGVSHSYAQSGNYTITLVAENNCGYTRTLTYPVAVGENTPPVLKPNSFGFFSESFSSLAGCAGDVVAFFIAGDYEHVWDFGDGTSATGTEKYLSQTGSIQTIARHAYPAPGTYYAKLTKTNNCGLSITDSVEVFISTSSSVQGFITAQAPLTQGGYNTCAPVTFMSGGGVSYTWNFGDGSSQITSAPVNSHLYTNPGVYATTVEVRNNCGSTSDYTFTTLINNGPVIDVNFTNVVNPTCSQSADGGATVIVNGGQEPYSIVWDNNQSLINNSVSNFTQGTHVVQISDANKCLITDTVVLNSGSTLGLNITFQQSSSCASATGAALVQNVGGVSPYTYSWSNGAVGQLANNLDVGIYYATVTDASSCKFTLPVNINSSTGPVLASQNIVSPTCYNGNNGIIAINITGGTAPYTYSWSNGATSSTLNNIASGDYTVTIQDNAGCKLVERLSVSQPLELTSSFVNKNADCSKFNGEASVVVTGGVQPYQYLWSEGSTTYKQNGLPIGDYDVTVTDANGCSKTFQTSIGNNNAPNVTANVNNIQCNGLNNGSISLTISGGTSPYLKTWLHNGSHSNSISNLDNGTYYVSVLDASGCQVYQSFNISEPNALTVNLISENALCNLYNGYINSNVSGGSLPYNYSWNYNNQTTQNLNGLTDGNYSLVVTDANGCVASASESISTVVNSENVCLVTVDETSTHNVIIWENPATGINGVSGFNIYRNAASTYVLVANVPAGQSTVFTDTTPGINPNATQYRYKISVLDSCSNESDLSLYHQTIWLEEPSYVQVGDYVSLQWANYAIENTPLDTTYYYRIELDTVGNGTWFGVDSVANGILNYNHINPPSSDTLIYRVVIVVPEGCEPTRARIATSRSNIKNTSRLTLLKNVSTVLVNVRPNPTNGILNITGDLVSEKPVNIDLYDINGRLIFHHQLKALSQLDYSMDISSFSEGMYHLQLSNETFVINKKIIKTN